MEKIIEKLEGKKRYAIILVFATYDLLKVFEIINTTQRQDVAIYVFLLALLGFEVESKIKLINKLLKIRYARK